MAVKILIKRLVKTGKTEQAAAMLKKLRSNAMDQPGYISGETMINHYDPRTVVIVSTWQNVESWIAWQQSDERETAEASLERLLEKPSKYEVYDVGLLPRE